MRIIEIELGTANLALVEAFYTKVLQLPLVQRQPHRLSFAAGYSLIHFNAHTEAAGIHHFAFLIPANLLLSSYQWIKNRIPILPFTEEDDIADFANWNAKAFYFHDGEQNILEFIAHYDLPLSSRPEYDSGSIIGIGEIGIGTDDVSKACEKLHTIYNIPYYKKGPHLSNFAAMGEEDGLLIVSEKGRGWIPTGQPACKNRLYIKVSVKEEKMNIHW